MSLPSISDIPILNTRLESELHAYEHLVEQQKSRIVGSWIRQAEDYGQNCAYKYEAMLKEAMAPYENYKSFYNLQDKQVANITERILNSPSTIISDPIKERIKQTGREFYVIKYHSNGQDLKCVVSYPKDKQHSSDLQTTVYLRGGGDLYGLPPPTTQAHFWSEDNIVVVPLGRGWEPEAGASDFGGPIDMADKMNAIRALPQMYETLQLAARVERFVLAGASNGGNYAVHLLEKYADELKGLVSHLILLSGALNYRDNFDTRPDCYPFWQREFGLSLERSENGYPKWVWKRDILKKELIDKIDKNIRILMIQALDDNCVHLHQGLSFLKEARKANLIITNWVATFGGHCAFNNPEVSQNIHRWLEDTTYLPEQFDVQRIAELSDEALFWHFSGSPGKKYDQ